MLRTPGFFTIVTLLGAGLAACSSNGNNTGPAGSGGQASGTGAASSTGSATGGSGGTGGGPGDYVACGDAKFPAANVLKFGSGSSTKTISQDTTWTKDNLYQVIGKLVVEGSAAPATLTVEAGTTICFESDTAADEDGNITVGENGPGGLLMNGTATEHVVMTSKDGMNGFYEGIHGGTGYTALSLTYVDIYNASAGNPYADCAVDTSDATTPAITVSHVTMHRLNAGCGIRLANTSGVTPDSSINVDSYVAGASNQLSVVLVDPVAAGTFPTGFVTVNTKSVPAAAQFIEFLTSEVNQTVTWHDAGLPYVSGLDDFFVRRSGASGAGPVLKVADGVTWQIQHGAMVYVGDSGHPGDLVLGEAGGPKKALITTRGDKTAASGYFGSIWFQNFDPAVSKIVNATIEFGGNASSGVKNCHSPNSVSTDRGMIVISGTGTYSGPTITGSTFSNSSPPPPVDPGGFTSDAILALCDGTDCIAAADDYTATATGNTFDHISGVSQEPTMPACP